MVSPPHVAPLHRYACTRAFAQCHTKKSDARIKALPRLLSTSSSIVYISGTKCFCFRLEKPRPKHPKLLVGRVPLSPTRDRVGTEQTHATLFDLLVRITPDGPAPSSPVLPACNAFPEKALTSSVIHVRGSWDAKPIPRKLLPKLYTCSSRPLHQAS